MAQGLTATPRDLSTQDFHDHGRPPLPPASFVDIVRSSLIDTHRLESSSLEQFGEQMERFSSFCVRGQGVRDIHDVGFSHAWAFVHSTRTDGSDPTPAWMHVRRGAIRIWFKEGRRLGLVTADPTLDMQLPPRSSLKTRPLTDDEVALCRMCALESLTDLRRALSWALSEATARTSELHRVAVKDVDLDSGRVFLCGSPQVLARWAPLTDWAAGQIERRLRAKHLGLKPDDRLVIWRAKTPKEPRAAASMAVIETLRAAGIHDEPDVRPRSITAWAGDHALRQGATIDEVARMLGCKRLDQTAEIIGFDWQGLADRQAP
jgi:site-specific recombinase XerC